MKKRLLNVVCLVLALVLVQGAWALAEEEAGFSFRNGVTWGMTMDEVAQSEGMKDYTVQQFGSFDGLAVKKARVALYEAEELDYLFEDGLLVAAVYDCEEDEADYSALLAGLNRKYGEGETMTSAEAVDLMSVLLGADSFYREDNFSRLMKWEREEVLVYIFFYGDDDFVILYFDPVYEPKISDDADWGL